MSRLPQLTKRTITKNTVPVGANTSRLPVPGTRTLQSRRDTLSGTSGKQLARVSPSDENIERPSLLQKRVFKQTLSKLVEDPGKKIKTMGVAKGLVVPPLVETKRGREAVVQQMKIHTTVQRTPKAEYIGKTMMGLDVDKMGVARQVEMTTQQIDPRYATESAGVNQTVSATSTLSITSGGRQLKKLFKKHVVKASGIAKKANTNIHHVSRLIKEETKDIENTLKMVPPDLVSSSIDKYPIKRNLQKLRLAAEPVSILMQSMVLPTPTADEVDVEAPPEVIAAVVDAVEKGATPKCAPNQIFNSLFPEVQEPKIDVSSVAPGPLEDVVVPTDRPIKLVEETMNQDMEDFLVAEVQNKQELLSDFICTDRRIAPESPTVQVAGDKTIPEIIEGEAPPWEDVTVRKIADIVGGDPLDFLDVSDVTLRDDPQELSQELSKGIEYFVDADVVPFETKIQLRGSKLPKWFPGYMSALPHTPNLVKLSRSPSEVLHAAWRAVQPKIFPEDAILIV